LRRARAVENAMLLAVSTILMDPYFCLATSLEDLGNNSGGLLKPNKIARPKTTHIGPDL